MEGTLPTPPFLLRVAAAGTCSVGLYGVVNEALFVCIGLVDKVVGFAVVMVTVVVGGVVGEGGGTTFVDALVEGVVRFVVCVVGAAVGCLVVVAFGCSNSVASSIISSGMSPS